MRLCEATGLDILRVLSLPAYLSGIILSQYTAQEARSEAIGNVLSAVGAVQMSEPNPKIFQKIYESHRYPNRAMQSEASTETDEERYLREKYGRQQGGA